MSPIRALLFDLDGTLIDSERLHKDAELETYAEFGLTPTEEEMKQGVGIPMRVTVERLARKYSLNMTPEGFRQKHQPRLSRSIFARMEMFQDAQEALLLPLPFRMGLVTSSERWYVAEVTRKFQPFFESFELHVCADDVQNGKPDPEPFLLACSRLGVEPAEAIAVEDSQNGLQSALLAGCQTVLIVRNGQALDVPGDYRRISSLLDLFQS